MNHPRFMQAVMHRVMNIQAEEKAQRAPASPSEDQGRRSFAPNDAVAYVDLQNLHHFLKENCRVPPTQVNIPELLRELATSNGLDLKEIQIFTGIHDIAQERHMHEAMAKRIRWLERNGCKVTALTLSYQFDSATGRMRGLEKGVDVRLGSELIRDVTDGLQKAMMITQDKDLSQAVKVAADIASQRGRPFEGYSPVLEGASWPHNEKCGMHGIAFTSKISFPVSLAQRHVRPPREGGDRLEAHANT
jgi:uncharacterized LabA/DUF88 family protein